MTNCSTCDAQLLPGSPFCDGCGSSQAQIKVGRKLRHKSFTTIVDTKGGLLQQGERISTFRNSYIIEESIAKSGFGATFRATRKKDKKQLLIKQMLDQASYDEFKKELFSAFKREARFLCGIKHPAFPRGYDSFQKHGSFFLVMDFINGKELAKAVEEYREKQGGVADGVLVYLGIEISQALSVIHDNGFIYRDLKPQNVMLDGISSRVKLIDFGTLLRSTDKNPLLFESAGYTPPEFMVKDSPFTPAGDIYSLGALLYEVATGTTPSGPDQTSELESSGRDKRIIEIIKKCLHLKPEDRFQKARQVEKAFSKLTRKGFWPFKMSNSIETIEIAVLPKALYPPQTTFCDYCGHADTESHFGYCPDCRVPLQVGRLEWKTLDKENTVKEFFISVEGTTVGAKSTDIILEDRDPENPVAPTHFKITKHAHSLWVELIDKKHNLILNQRHVRGPVELMDGDELSVGAYVLKFSLIEAC